MTPSNSVSATIFSLPTSQTCAYWVVAGTRRHEHMANIAFIISQHCLLQHVFFHFVVFKVVFRSTNGSSLCAPCVVLSCPSVSQTRHILPNLCNIQLLNRQKERKREREKERGRQTERQRETERQRHIDRQGHRLKDRERQRGTERQRDTMTESDRDIQRLRLKQTVKQ